jgi:hypothetical protein
MDDDVIVPAVILKGFLKIFPLKLRLIYSQL